MTNLAVNTSQNVNIDFVAASVGERILAFIIDYAILFAYYFIIILFVGYLNLTDYWSMAGIIGFLMLPAMSYTLFFETIWGGQTVGKKVLKLKVVKIDGFEAGFQDYLVRWVLRLVDIFTSSGAIAIISIVMSPRSQRLGDMAAGTAIISLKNRVHINQTILMKLEDTYEPKYPEAQLLSDNDARIIKNNYEIAYKDGNYELLEKLRKRLEEVLNLQKGTISDIDFIHHILKDFNYYTGK